MNSNINIISRRALFNGSASLQKLKNNVVFQARHIPRLFKRGGGSVSIEPLRQLSDDCTHRRNSKRKVGKPINQ